MLLALSILGRLLPRIGGWLAALVAVYAIADATDLGSRGATAPWSVAPLRLAAMVFQSLPIALAAAVAHTLVSMRQNGEWTGAMASGASAFRLARPFVLVIALVATVGFAVGDRLAPACARAYRSAGGGDPPGAVWLGRSSENWTRTASGLARSGPRPLVVRFPGDGRRPRVETPNAPLAGPRVIPPATDLELTRMSAAARSAPDPLPYLLESSFRPLTAAAAILLPLLVLALLIRRAPGPRGAALFAGLACLAGFATIAASYNFALGGVIAPPAAAIGAGSVLAALALCAALTSTRSVEER